MIYYFTSFKSKKIVNLSQIPNQSTIMKQKIFSSLVVFLMFTVHAFSQNENFALGRVAMDNSEYKKAIHLDIVEKWGEHYIAELRAFCEK